MKRAGLILLAVLAPGAATPALAQAWIGQMAAENGRAVQEDRCMRGLTAPSGRELTEAQVPAQALIAAYWRLAAAAGTPDLAAAFRRSGDIAWTDGEARRERGQLAGARDPFAGDAGLVVADSPFSFARAGTDPSERADGIWLVHARGDPSAIAGHYYVEFRRDIASRWGIARMWLVHRTTAPEPVAPFCREPGDVARYAAMNERYDAIRQAERERDRERRRARLARERAARSQPVR